MGFLKRIFGGNEKVPVSEKTMTIGDVGSFLSKKMKSDFTPLEKSARKEHANLQLAASELLSNVKSLMKATYSGETYPMLIRKAVGSRKTFCDKMELVARQVKKPIGNDIESILGFNNDTAKLINEINDKAVKEYAFLKELFEDDAYKVIQSFRKIVDIDKRLGEMVSEFSDSNSILIKATQVLSELGDVNIDIEKDYDFDERISENTSRMEKIDRELKDIINGDEWKSFLDNGNKAENIKMELDNKKSDFMKTISRIESPLKKHAWSVKDKILDYYVWYSFDSVLSKDPKGELLLSSLTEMMNKISSGKIEVKNTKVVDYVNDMIKNNTVGMILGDYSRLYVELEDLKTRLSKNGIADKKSRLENELSLVKQEIERLKNEKERMNKRKDELKKKKDDIVESLESMLSEISGKDIHLDLKN